MFGLRSPARPAARTSRPEALSPGRSGETAWLLLVRPEARTANLARGPGCPPGGGPGSPRNRRRSRSSCSSARWQEIPPRGHAPIRPAPRFEHRSAPGKVTGIPVDGRECHRDPRRGRKWTDRKGTLQALPGGSRENGSSPGRRPEAIRGSTPRVRWAGPQNRVGRATRRPGIVPPISEPHARLRRPPLWSGMEPSLNEQRPRSCLKGSPIMCQTDAPRPLRAAARATSASALPPVRSYLVRHSGTKYETPWSPPPPSGGQSLGKGNHGLCDGGGLSARRGRVAAVATVEGDDGPGRVGGGTGTCRDPGSGCGTGRRPSHIWSGVTSPWKMLPPVRPIRFSMSGGPRTSDSSRHSGKSGAEAGRSGRRTASRTSLRGGCPSPPSAILVGGVLAEDPPGGVCQAGAGVGS